MRIARFSKPLTIALHPEVFDRIKEITDKEQRSMADWVREAVDQAEPEEAAILPQEGGHVANRQTGFRAGGHAGVVRSGD